MTIGSFVRGCLTLSFAIAIVLFSGAYAKYAFYKDLTDLRESQMDKVEAGARSGCNNSSPIYIGVMKHCIGGIKLREFYFYDGHKIAIVYYEDGQLRRIDLLDDDQHARVRNFYRNNLHRKRSFIDENGVIIEERPLNLLQGRGVIY